jgi:monoamine oxidase
MISRFRTGRRSFLRSSMAGLLLARLGAFLPPATRAATGSQGSPPATGLKRRGNPQKVLILGAGLSGLAAGIELQAAGHAPIILEAQRRPGGRVLTLRDPFSDGLYVEAGAGRIPANHSWTHAYARRFQLEQEPFSPATATSSWYVSGRRIPVTRETDPLSYFDFSAQERRLGIGGIVQKYISSPLQQIQAAGDVTDPAWPPESLRGFEQYTFVEFLRSRGASAGAIEYLLLGAYPTEASALFIFRALATTDLAHLTKIKGGNDLLPKAMAAALGDRLIYDARVTRIEHGKDNVRAIFQQQGMQQSLTADTMICTIPFSVLKSIEVSPRFSLLKHQAIQDLHYAPVVKIALQTRNRYWLREGLSGFAQLDTSAEIWSPGWDSPGRAGILQLYQEGERALELDQMSEQRRLEFASESIGHVFPGLEADLEHSLSFSWQRNPWSRGAYSELRPGQAYGFAHALPRREGRIHFAGEHTSTEPGWMHGALASGYRAAKEVNELPRA